MIYAPTALNVRVTGRRVVATFIDGIIFGIISTILSGVFDTNRSSGFSFTQLSFGGSFLMFVIVLLYYTLLEGSIGKTVGKMVTGIKVIDENGRPPGYLKGLVRTLLRIIDGLFVYLVGFIVVLSADRRRRLGDMAAKTQVVRG
jgi:uncharacterized RDD family membrane protein YckC